MLSTELRRNPTPAVQSQTKRTEVTYIPCVHCPGAELRQAGNIGALVRNNLAAVPYNCRGSLIEGKQRNVNFIEARNSSTDLLDVSLHCAVHLHLFSR